MTVGTTYPYIIHYTFAQRPKVLCASVRAAPAIISSWEIKVSIHLHIAAAAAADI